MKSRSRFETNVYGCSSRMRSTDSYCKQSPFILEWSYLSFAARWLPKPLWGCHSGLVSPKSTVKAQSLILSWFDTPTLFPKKTTPKNIFA